MFITSLPKFVADTRIKGQYRDNPTNKSSTKFPKAIIYVQIVAAIACNACFPYISDQWLNQQHTKMRVHRLAKLPSFNRHYFDWQFDFQSEPLLLGNTGVCNPFLHAASRTPAGHLVLTSNRCSTRENHCGPCDSGAGQ